MKITEHQAHVLANLDRVVLRPYRVKIANPVHRYDLDEKDCTGQIAALIVRKMVFEHPDGRLERTGQSAPIKPKSSQRPSLDAIDQLRQACMAPVSVHRERRLTRSAAGSDPNDAAGPQEGFR